MRNFMRFPPRTLWFRLLLVLGAFALLAAFASSAKAACTNCLVRYYNFEGAPTAPYPVNLFSNLPAVETGAGTNLTLLGPDPPGAAYPPGNTLVGPQIVLNLPPGVVPPGGVASLGTNRNGATGTLNVEIPFFSVVGVYDIKSVSFAYGANGNGYNAVQVFMSSDGGVTFTSISVVVALGSTPGSTRSFVIPAGTTLNIPNLVIRLSFTGGQSNGADLQFELDNVQIGGDVLPEPATVAGGLLGVLGLCWFQRRRLKLLLPRSRRA